MVYQNPDGTYGNEGGGSPITTFVPVTGATVTVPARARRVYVNPAAGIAALTIALPKGPVRGEYLEVSFGQAITAITWQDGSGNTVSGLASAGAAGVATAVVYAPKAATPGAPNYGWVKWR